ncbi:MAG: hypothetical protein P8J27_00140 [Mariniblastus sp.]|nr:hypothetical protein [Mariniblastus sp.]
MSIYDLRDPEKARRYVLEGLLFSAATSITENTVHDSLSWAMEIVSEGTPLPCLGLVADIGLIATGQNSAASKNDFDAQIQLDRVLIRQYEDYVLGKIFADSSFERASEALAKYEARDRRRAVAFIIKQICDRSEVGGAMLSLAVLKRLTEIPPAEVIQLAVRQVHDVGWSEPWVKGFKSTMMKIQNVGELLGREDIFELEQGTVLDEFGQRVALRQVLRTSGEIELELPVQRPRTPARKYSVATNIMEEDAYPIGGFTSISNKGTIESLLRSELAYLEEDSTARPDLFDIKYVRDELLYYSRDENQFLRRRLSFVFLFDSSLITARYKDPELPVQRIVLLLAFLVSTVRKLLDWLGDDSIVFEFLFPEDVDHLSLADEQSLLERVFCEQIIQGLVQVRSIAVAGIPDDCNDQARQSLCHAVVLTADDQRDFDTGELAIRSRIVLDKTNPEIFREDQPGWRSDDEGMEGWIEVSKMMSRFWVS